MAFKRMVLPLVLLSFGAGMLVYGAVFHAVTILEEEETELSIPILAPFGAPMSFGADEYPVDPFDHDFHAPDDGSFAERDPFDQGAWPPDAMEENPFAVPPEQRGDLPPEEPWFPDPHGMMFETVTQITLIARMEREWVLVREVTIGGVARLENGELKRTYSGKPPALCPT